MGVIPSLGARLARATFSPDLLLSDGEAYLVAGDVTGDVVEGWLPYRAVFDLVASGRRHVMMGASQLDRYGNQNISCVGDWSRPKAQLLGVRGAPGNTVNHPVSYWVPRHSRRVFVERVDLVCGVGNDRRGGRFHRLRVVVTDLAVLDFATPDGALRLRSVHPGVTVEEVVVATGFPLVVDRPDVTRAPSAEELRLIREVLDPHDRRGSEVPARQAAETAQRQAAETAQPRSAETAQPRSAETAQPRAAEMAQRRAAEVGQ
jgi:acyl CoA:acetate/3-ketoacid CoA transferase beta subunit